MTNDISNFYGTSNEIVTKTYKPGSGKTGRVDLTHHAKLEAEAEKKMAEAAAAEAAKVAKEQAKIDPEKYEAMTFEELRAIRKAAPINRPERHIPQYDRFKAAISARKSELINREKDEFLAYITRKPYSDMSLDELNEVIRKCQPRPESKIPQYYNKFLPALKAAREAHLKGE